MGKSIITEFSILKFKKQNKEVVAFFFLYTYLLPAGHS